MGSSLDIFDFIADAGQVLLESVLADDYRSATVIGMERERVRFLQAAIQKENDMMVGIVDQPERTDTSGFKSQVSHHPLERSKREFAGRFESLRDEDILEPMLDIMNRQIVVTGETDEVMLIALMIAHEDIFAMNGTIVMPPPFGFLYSLSFGMIIGREGDMMFVQIAQDALLAIGYDFVVIHIFKIVVL